MVIFFLSVCVKSFFFQIEKKNIQVLTFMISIYSCLPMFSMFLKSYEKIQKNTKQNSTGAKNNGLVGRLFFFRNWKTKVGRFFKGQLGNGKQTFFLCLTLGCDHKWFCHYKADWLKITSNLLCWKLGLHAYAIIFQGVKIYYTQVLTLSDLRQ